MDARALPKISRKDAKDAKWIFRFYFASFAPWRPNVQQNYWAKPRDSLTTRSVRSGTRSDTPDVSVCGPNSLVRLESDRDQRLGLEIGDRDFKADRFTSRTLKPVRHARAVRRIGTNSRWGDCGPHVRTQIAAREALDGC